MINRVVAKPEEKAVSTTQGALVGLDNVGGEFITLIGPTAGPGGSWSIGSLPLQRIGTEIYVKKVEIQWVDYIPTLSYGNSYRVIMFIDHSGTNTTSMFGGNEPFMNNATATAGVSVISQYNRDTVGFGGNKNYHVLSDRMYHNFLSGGGDSDAAQRYMPRRISHTFPFKGMKILLAPTDLALGNTIAFTNQIYVWFIRASPLAQAPGSTDEINVDNIRSTVYFTDA